MMTVCSEPDSATLRLAHRRAEDGSTLLGVVALMLLVSVLGVTLLTHLSSSSQGTLVTDSGNQAFFMAESGARYAIARILKGREAAADAMNGQRFTLSGGRAFDLAIEVQVVDGATLYCIDCTGISHLGLPTERHALNGYVVEVAPLPPVAAPIGFYYGVQIAGRSTLTMGSNTYIDSYNSSDPATYWTEAGVYNDATVSVDMDTNAASFAAHATLHGNLLVGAGADLTDPTTITNDPDAVQGDAGILPSATTVLALLNFPAEAAEVAAPSPLKALPSFAKSGTPTIAGGNYTYSGNLDLSKADLTLSGSSYLRTTGSFSIPNAASLKVNGDFSASVGTNTEINGDPDGLKVLGSADLALAGSLTISGGGGIYVRDTLDLDIGGNLSHTGDLLHLGGAGDIDVAGSVTFGNNSSVYLGGRELLRVGNGFNVSGDTALTFAPSGYLYVHVTGGAVSFTNNATVDTGQDSSRLLIICDPAVTSVTLSSNSVVYAGIYAPSAAVSLGSNSELFGTLVCRSLTMNGNAALHVDTAMVSDPAGLDPNNLRFLRRMWVAAGD